MEQRIVVSVPVAVDANSPKLTQFDTTSVYEARSRAHEVATVNAHKAPELLACFNLAYLDLSDHLARLAGCLHEASKEMNRIRSRIILDEVPEILRAKGISSSRNPGGSEDQRQAILDCNEEYLAASDRVAQVKAMIQLFKDHRDGIEQAYTSVKKILGDNLGHPAGLVNPQRRYDSSTEGRVVGDTPPVPQITGIRASFGQPK